MYCTECGCTSRCTVALMPWKPTRGCPRSYKLLLFFTHSNRDTGVNGDTVSMPLNSCKAPQLWEMYWDYFSCYWNALFGRVCRVRLVQQRSAAQHANRTFSSPCSLRLCRIRSRLLSVATALEARAQTLAV